MRKSEEAPAWVVYATTLPGNADLRMVVCRQSEWDAMGQAAQDRYTLVRSGIANEAEAELLARGTSGDPKAKPSQRRT